jgi:hypothetical protein
VPAPAAQFSFAGGIGRGREDGQHGAMRGGPALDGSEVGVLAGTVALEHRSPGRSQMMKPCSVRSARVVSATIRRRRNSACSPTTPSAGRQNTGE